MTHAQFEAWLSDAGVAAALAALSPVAVDTDRCFSLHTDADYCLGRRGIPLTNFADTFEPWVQYCRRAHAPDAPPPVDVYAAAAAATARLRFLYVLSLAVRRALYARRAHAVQTLEDFLANFLAIFRGRAPAGRPTTDALWFALPGLFAGVVQAAARLALRLHQDHFADPDGNADPSALWESLGDYVETEGPFAQVVCAETDPAWARAVLGDRPSLLSLR